MDRINVSFDEDDLNKIKDFAKDKRLSLSSAIRELAMESIVARHPNE